MRTIRLKITDLFEFEGRPPPSQTPDVVEITPLVLKRFGFLPQPLVVTTEGAEVIISFPEESAASQAEARRLSESLRRSHERNHTW